jgi:hypothetical protein
MAETPFYKHIYVAKIMITSDKEEDIEVQNVETLRSLSKFFA